MQSWANGHFAINMARSGATMMAQRSASFRAKRFNVLIIAVYTENTAHENDKLKTQVKQAMKPLNCH